MSLSPSGGAPMVRAELHQRSVLDVRENLGDLAITEAVDVGTTDVTYVDGCVSLANQPDVRGGLLVDRGALHCWISCLDMALIMSSIAGRPAATPTLCRPMTRRGERSYATLATALLPMLLTLPTILIGPLMTPKVLTRLRQIRL
jgi:hypothetical protein